MSSTDRIEKVIVLKAPRSKVWRAITTANDFNTWFKVRLQGEFAPGNRLKGPVTHAGYEHVILEIVIERMDAESLFSYRWHPNAVDMTIDYSKDPMTLVEFRLKEVPEGTELTIVESGFDSVPVTRRETAFRSNGKGWEGQLKAIAKYVEV